MNTVALIAAILGGVVSAVAILRGFAHVLRAGTRFVHSVDDLESNVQELTGRVDKLEARAA